MVIIHQQTTESGSNKFISTVVESTQDTTSYTSAGFSLNSQLSISERSAVYKQRIDSLFGRPTKLRASNKTSSVEPFRIRIDGKSLSPTSGLLLGPSGRRISASTSVLPISTTTISHTKTYEGQGFPSTSSEDDDYLRLNDNSSIVTDSLNHQPKVTRKGNNVSSVRITCDDSESSSSHLPSRSLMHTASSSGEEGVMVVGRSEIGSDKIMWRNNNYGETSSSSGNSGSRTDKPFSTVRCSPGGMLKFPVEYLGSIPVTGNTATLQDLQTPLKDLYINYLSNKNIMNGQLAITSDGLRFEAPKLRLVNPFTTIAVWAAVKFVGRGEPLPTECAFMPLISDPVSSELNYYF